MNEIGIKLMLFFETFERIEVKALNDRQLTALAETLQSGIDECKKEMEKRKANKDEGQSTAG